MQYAEGAYGRCVFFWTKSSTGNAQLTPQRGMMQSLVVIISFHSIFLTKVDRAYKVQCFYMEAEKTVTADLEVGLLQVMPFNSTCAIGVNVDNGRVARCGGNATVHLQCATGKCRWLGSEVCTDRRACLSCVGMLLLDGVFWSQNRPQECPSNTHDILVKDCYVDDGQGNRFEMLDDRGCE